MAACRERRRGRCAHREVNGAAGALVRRRWRRWLTAFAAAVAVGLLARAGTALDGGDATTAAARLAVSCAFVAGLLGGRLIEGLRHPPRPMVWCSWRRRRS